MQAWKEGAYCKIPPKHVDQASQGRIIKDRDLINLTIAFLQCYKETMEWDKVPLEPKYRANVHKALNALSMGHARAD